MEDQPYLQWFFLTCSQNSISLYGYVSAVISIVAYNRNSFLLWTVSILLLLEAQQLKNIISISNCLTGYVPPDTLCNAIEESVWFFLHTQLKFPIPNC